MADSDKESGEGGHRDWNFNIDSSQRELDLFFPIEDVRSAMRKSLPANPKISKDAEETVQECVSGFISLVTGVALDKCQREKRKAIDADDVLYAITILGFEDYVEPLKIYLQILRASEDEKTAMAGGRGDKAAVASGGGNGSVEYGHDWGWPSRL